MSDAVKTRHIKTWVFDLDNTLYPETSSLFGEINGRMNVYMADLLDMSVETASALRQGFYERHGTTLNGLMREYDADPYPFLDYVHRVDLSRISPAPRLKSLLRDLPRCLVHTNGTVAHATRVLNRLGIADCFSGIFDIVASGFQPKPAAPAFAGFIEAFDTDPATTIMLEDREENLAVPHGLGMKTVWINHLADSPDGASALPDHAHVHHVSPSAEGFLADALK
jgi:putative hydrolase of the HAD superfamily